MALREIVTPPNPVLRRKAPESLDTPVEVEYYKNGGILYAPPMR